MNLTRYYALDAIRGVALLNMIAYHAVWDLVYLRGFDWPWYHSGAAYVWQQAICCTFIFLSGFCQSLGHRRLKNGLCTFLAGLLVSAATFAVMPENRVVFGALTLIGSCMLLMIPFCRILEKCNPLAGVLACTVLFFLTRNVNEGFLGFGGFNIVKLPERLYRNLLTAYLGFPAPDFVSTDYFSLFPWAFLFAAGYFLYRLLCRKELLGRLAPSRLKPVEWVGRRSLGIYMAHQPILYLLFTLLPSCG